MVLRRQYLLGVLFQLLSGYSQLLGGHLPIREALFLPGPDEDSMASHFGCLLSICNLSKAEYIITISQEKIWGAIFILGSKTA